MQQDVEHSYQQYLDHSHHGHPSVIETAHTGRPGRPAYHIDPDFLQWAYATRSISLISRFLGISRRSAWNAVLAHGFADPQISPFVDQDSNSEQSSNGTATRQNDHNFLLDPLLPIPDQPDSSLLQNETHSYSEDNRGCITSFTGPLSVITDEALDSVILQLCQQFTRAGITMLHGML